MARLKRSSKGSAATSSGAEGQQRTWKGGSVARANMRNTMMWRCCSRVDGGQRLLGRLKLHNAPALGAACTQSRHMQSQVSAQEARANALVRCTADVLPPWQHSRPSTARLQTAQAA